MSSQTLDDRSVDRKSAPLLGPRLRSPRLDPVYVTRFPETSFLDRVDPFYEIEYHDVIRAKWERIHTVNYELGFSPRGTLVHYRYRTDSWIAMPPAVLYSPRAIRTVALLSQFHQMSTMQISAALGCSDSQAWKTLRGLYDAGLLSRAIPEWWRDNDDRPRGGTGSIWRLSSDKDHLGEWLDGLDDLEYMLISSGTDLLKGTPGGSSPTAARHNLSATEVLLRAMESCQGVVGVWGEAPTTAELLSLDTYDDRLRRNIGDGAVVGKDGRVIVIEFVGSNKPDDPAVSSVIQSKAAGWAAVMARTPLDLYTLFVDISVRSRHDRMRWQVMKGVDEGARKYLSRSDMVEMAQSRTFVASARDWFPFPSVMAEGFLSLQAFAPWEDKFVDLLPTDTVLDRKSDVVVNTISALHVPYWITDPVAPIVSTD